MRHIDKDRFPPPIGPTQEFENLDHLLDALKGGIVVAEGTKRVGHAIWAGQGAQQQLKGIQGACQPLV